MRWLSRQRDGGAAREEWGVFLLAGDLDLSDKGRDSDAMVWTMCISAAAGFEVMD